MSVASPYTEESTSKFVQAGEVKIHYHEAGSGPVVVLIHGGGPGATGWLTYWKNVEAFAAHFRTLIIDLPQFGQSDAPIIPIERSLFNARVLKDFLEALGIDKASLVGNSMGGGSAIDFATNFPDRLDKLVLMGTSGAGDSLFTPVPTEGDILLRKNFQNPTFETMKALIEVMTYDSSFITDELVQRRLEGAQNPDIRAARRASFRKEGEPMGELHKIQAKTLVIWGREDRTNPFDQGLSCLARIPNCDLVIWGKCGHWAQFERADDFNRLVTDFLRH
ncbi:MAG: alpha/beta fold hydrolase [Chloroflexi bacterium]|nr:alpha/beta fold hydrolase [Chloroflexota bacterium]